MTTSKLTVPDSKRLSAVQELCDFNAPYSTRRDVDKLFVKAMKQSIKWHRDNCSFYDKLCKSVKFSESSLKTSKDVANTPYILAHFLKTHEVLSISKKSVSTHLTSSGTSGQKSQMFFDDWTLKSAQRMIDYIFAYYGWITKEKANYLLYSYEPKPGMKIGTSYTDNFLCKYAPSQEVFFALRNTGTGTHEFDVFGCIEKLKEYEAQGLPVRIFGFPAFLHFTIERMKEMKIPKIKLHKDSLIFLGGGWKGNQNKAIPKSELYTDVTKYLGIPDHRLKDGFGSVEHCIPYIECKCHNFHIPVWSKVFARDFKTLKVLPKGQKGFLHFVSPYITSVPAQSVVMGDVASVHDAKECGCELKTPYFVIHGRAGTSKNKSCAVAAAELLKGKK